MSALAEACVLVRHHRLVFSIYQVKKAWTLRMLFCISLLGYALLYPILVFYYALRTKARDELRYMDRLRFHWDRPLTIPIMEGGGYNFLDYLRRQQPGGEVFDDTKLGWRRRFIECGLRTPDVFLVFDDSTPLTAARDIPHVDLVVKPNCGGKGRGVIPYRFDARTERFNGSLTAEDIIRLSRENRNRNLERQSYLVTREIVGSSRMPHQGLRHHLRCITVKRGDEPILFRAMMHVQFDKARFATNHSQGGNIFTVNSGVLDGSRLPYFQEAVAGCIAVHRRLDFVSVAFDLMIADDGPYYFEGNINHGVYFQEMPGFYSVLRDYYVATGLLPPRVTDRLSRALGGA